MKKNRWLSVKILSLILLGGSLFLLGCNDQKNAGGVTGKQDAPKQQVEVFIVEPKPVDIMTTLPARINPYLIAEIRPQVGGTILKREFIEGSIVQEGQSLYQIDPAPYQATYESAKASLVKAQASAKVSRLTTERYRKLLNSNSISRQDFDQQAALSDQADAEVVVAQAQVEQAKINLNYTRVYSPITGRIGKSTVTEGALVTANQTTALATVQQIEPIYLDMNQSAVTYMDMQQKLATGKLKRLDGKAVVNIILDTTGELYSHPGDLQFSDITVNETTSTIALRALFSNPNNVLLPGMFVRAELYEGTLPDGIVIPQKTLTRDAKGNGSVMIVNDQGIVESRPVVANQTIGNEWIVNSGLKPGDRVITAGLLKVKAGQAVQVIDSKPSESGKGSSPVVPKPE